MENQELKRCPFCGGEAEVDFDVEESENRMDARCVCFVTCIVCGCRTRLFDLSQPECDYSRAIRMWNKRAGG